MLVMVVVVAMVIVVTVVFLGQIQADHLFGSLIGRGNQVRIVCGGQILVVRGQVAVAVAAAAPLRGLVVVAGVLLAVGALDKGHKT
jgi:hypothetical protein